VDMIEGRGSLCMGAVVTAWRFLHYRTKNVRPQLRIYPSKRAQPAVWEKESEVKGRVGGRSGTFMTEFSSISTESEKS
jgi:hypothetical protein